ncbi:MAG: hypothetical protein GW886_02475 [Rhodobacterales bacterium]|nr:hypothetical protein [Rhodobacterales bacterium]NCT11623.1 hypothetical protein [Rhodobacterales bacterium]
MRCLPVMLLCLAAQAHAGAWPRDEGALFIVTGGNVALFGDAVRPVHYDPTFFLEYGMTPGLTLGLQGHTADAGTSGTVLGFGRLHLHETPGGDHFAISAAYGLTMIPTGAVETVVRGGLHWGRGLPHGWVAVDGYATLTLDNDRLESKIDAIWGHRLNDRWTTMLSAEAGTGLEGDFYAKLAPSISLRISERADVRIGLVRALTGDRGGGLTVESWLRF